MERPSVLKYQEMDEPLNSNVVMFIFIKCMLCICKLSSIVPKMTFLQSYRSRVRAPAGSSFNQVLASYLLSRKVDRDVKIASGRQLSELVIASRLAAEDHVHTRRGRRGCGLNVTASRSEVTA